jgi:hypothetical protein
MASYITGLLVVVAALAPVTGGAESQRSDVRLTYPGRTWTLEVDLPGFEIGRLRQREEGRIVSVDAYEVEVGLLAEVELDRARPGETSEALLERTFKELRVTLPGEPVRIDRSFVGDIAVLDYRIELGASDGQSRRALHGFLVHDGVAVHLHLTQAQAPAVPSVTDPMDAAVRSMRVVEAPR